MELVEIFRILWLFIQRGIAYDLPGILYGRVLPIVGIIFATMTGVKLSQTSSKICYGDLLTDDPSRSVMAHSICYAGMENSPMYTEFTDGTTRFHGYYDVAPYFFVALSAVILLLSDLTFHFASGVSFGRLLQELKDLDPEHSAKLIRDTFNWMRLRPLAECLANKSPPKRRRSAPAPTLDSGDAVSFHVDFSSTPVHQPITTQGWQYHKTSRVVKQRYRLTLTIMISKVVAVLLCVGHILAGDWMFAITPSQLFSPGSFPLEGFCNVSFYEAVDLRKETLRCSLTANSWLAPVLAAAYLVNVALAGVVAISFVRIAIRLIKKRSWIQAATIRYLRRTPNSIDLSNVASFCKAIPYDIYVVLISIQSNVLPAALDETLGLLYLEDDISFVENAPVKKTTGEVLGL